MVPGHHDHLTLAATKRACDEETWPRAHFSSKRAETQAADGYGLHASPLRHQDGLVHSLLRRVLRRPRRDLPYLLRASAAVKLRGPRFRTSPRTRSLSWGSCSPRHLCPRISHPGKRLEIRAVYYRQPRWCRTAGMSPPDMSRLAMHSTRRPCTPSPSLRVTPARLP